MKPNTKLVVVTLVLALILMQATAQNTCGMTIAGLYSCKPYVQIKNPLTTAIDPSGPCCTALSKADIPCLCKEKNKFNPFLSGIDLGLAAKIPEKCNLPSASC